MTSISTAPSGHVKVDHVIRTAVTNNLPPNTYTRTVSVGQPVLGSFRVESYRTEPLGNRKIPVQKVNSYEEYAAGCTEHERCIGHFCVTPRGTLLLPQKMVSTLGIMSNEYARMAEMVFNRDTPSQELVYREKFRSLMLGKSGKMRGDMVAGAVDSSAREIIASCWVEGGYFAVPKMVAQNMRVLRIGTDEITGLPLNHYIEDCLREGDTVLAIRPPSLWAGNVQPMKVLLWDHECFGVSASNTDEFHADHDGDEMQIYFIGRDESLEECKKWKELNSCKFLEAVKINKLPQSLTKFVTNKSGEITDEGYKELRKEFMVSSTVSVKELIQGVKMPNTSKAARMKEPMVNMFVERLNNPDKVFKDFYYESIRGIKDVMAQQLNQGYLGDMSRQARLAASCIKYKGNGIFHIMTAKDTIRVVCTQLNSIDKDIKYPLGGNACMRAVSALCGVAQQAALDSHRVSQDVVSKLDLINNLIVGSKESLIALQKGSLPPHSWKYQNGNIVYCVVDNKKAKPWASKIIAGYNPIILRAVQLVNGDVQKVCRNGITMVCSYYGVSLSILELYSLTTLLCYRSEDSTEPITTKKGLLQRDMRWIVVVFANHYGKLKDLQLENKTNKSVRPQTITDAVALCNFDYM